MFGNNRNTFNRFYPLSRLTTKWMVDLCMQYITPSLAELLALNCHGPVGYVHIIFYSLQSLILSIVLQHIYICLYQYAVNILSIALFSPFFLYHRFNNIVAPFRLLKCASNAINVAVILYVNAKRNMIHIILISIRNRK